MDHSLQSPEAAVNDSISYFTQAASTLPTIGVLRALYFCAHSASTLITNASKRQANDEKKVEGCRRLMERLNVSVYVSV